MTLTPAIFIVMIILVADGIAVVSVGYRIVHFVSEVKEKRRGRARTRARRPQVSIIKRQRVFPYYFIRKYRDFEIF
jgi:hypothetical protein